MAQVRGHIKKILPDAESKFGSGAVFALDTGEEIVRFVAWDFDDSAKVGDLLVCNEAKRGEFKNKTSYSAGADKVQLNPSNGGNGMTSPDRGSRAAPPSAQYKLSDVMAATVTCIQELQGELKDDGAIAEVVCGVLGLIESGVVQLEQPTKGEDDRYETFPEEPDDLGF